MHLELQPHQLLAAKFLLENPRGMLIADPGLGKTSAALYATEALDMLGSNYLPALCLAPKRVANVVWTAERDKWDEFKNLSITKIMGEKDARIAALRSKIADIYVMNYELIPWLVSQFPGKQWPFKSVICDESHKVKGLRISKGGIRAAALKSIAEYTHRWWNLTGTPIPNGLQDIWGQMWFVDGGSRLKPTYTAFMEAFFTENQWTHELKLQYGAKEAINKLIADKILVLRAEDWLDLQKPQFTTIDVELSIEHKAKYRKLAKEYYLELEHTKIKADTAAIKSSKCLQFCSGSVYSGRGKSRQCHPIHEAKLEALEDILEQIFPEPLLLSYWWVFDAERVLSYCAKKGIAARAYKDARDGEDFRSGRIRVLLLHGLSAEGLNLAERCRDVCFYSYYWSPTAYQQTIERVGPVRQAQIGSKKIVRVWTIRVLDTIEDEVIESNQGKISTEQALKLAHARCNYDV